MKRSPVLLLTLVLIVALSSCKNKSGLFIPADAIVVMHVNPSSFSSKISWNEIKNSPWFQDLYKQADDSLAQKILNDPEAAGMDVKSDFFMFLEKHGAGGYGVFEGAVKDVAAFEAMNKKLSSKDKIETDGDYKIIAMNKSTLVAWDDKKFAYINDMPQLGMNNSFGNMYDGESGSKALSADSLKLLAKNILSNEGTSLQGDDRFTGLIKESGDMHLWFNASSAFTGLAGGVMDMMKVSSLIEGNAAGMAMNFEDGKISVKSKNYVNSELAKLLEKYETKKISTDVLNRIPINDLLGVWAMNINPQTIKDFLHAAGFDGLFNSFLRKQGLTINDVFSAINGQFVMAVGDMQKKDSLVTMPGLDGKPGDSYTNHYTDLSVLFAAGVGNQTSFQKLLDIIPKNHNDVPATYKLTSQWFAGSNKPAVVDGFMSGATTKQTWTDKITGHPFGAYVNLQKILSANASGNSTADSLMKESANFWQDIVATGGEFKNGTSTGEFVINMVDKKTNSLKQLNAYIGRLHAAQRRMMDSQMNDMNHGMVDDDSTSTTPMRMPPAIDTAQ